MHNVMHACALTFSVGQEVCSKNINSRAIFFALLTLSFGNAMYEIKHLKRLKKGELIEISNVSKVEIDGRKTKAEIMRVLADHEQSASSTFVESTEHNHRLPVDFKEECLFYRSLTDDMLHVLPDCSFHELFRYFRGANAEGSMKNLDRAAKHSSAGDVSSVKICQVYLDM